MAILSLDTSWSGTVAGYIIMKTMYSMDTLMKGVVAVDSGIKKIHTIDRIDLVNPLSPTQTTPTNQPGSGWTIDSRIMTPQNFQTFQVANPRDFESTYWSQFLADPILQEILPTGGPDIEGKMLQSLLGRCGEAVENMLWMGSTAYQGHYVFGDANYQLQFFNGYMQRIVNDPLCRISTLSKIAITNTGVFAILDDLLNLAGVYYKALIIDPFAQRDMRFLVSVKTWLLYKEQLANTSFKGGDLDYSGTYLWKGFQVQPLAGFPDDTIILSRVSTDPNVGNFHVAMNSMSDWNLKVGKVDGNIFDERYAMLGKWKMDVNYGWSDQIFVYTTLTAASFTPPVVTPE